VYLAYQEFIFCQKGILSNHFATLILLAHNRLINFNEMSFSVVNPVVVVAVLLLQRIFNENKLFSDL